MWVDPYTTKKIVSEQLETQRQADELRKEHGLTQEDTAESASFLDRAGTAYDMIRFQMKDTYEERLSQEIDKSRAEFHKYNNTLDVQKGYQESLLGTQSVREMGLDDWKSKTKEIEKLKEDHPEAYVQTYDEIEGKLAKEFLDLTVKDEVQTANNDWSDMLGFAAGSIGGYLTSPVNAFTAAMPVGKLATAGEGLVKLAVSAGKFAAQEQVVSAYQFARDEPTSVAIREKAYGVPVTAEQQGEEFLMQQGMTALGSLIPPALIAGYRGIRARYADIPSAQLNKETGPVTKDLEYKLYNSNLSEEQANVIQDTIDLAKTTPEGLQQAQHARNYEAAQRSFKTGVDMEIPFSKNVVDDSIPPNEPIKQQTVDTNIFKEETIPNTVKEKYNKMDSYLASLDQNELVPNEVADDGTAISRNTIGDVRAKLKNMEDDTSAINAVFDCWIGGGPKGG